MPLTYYDKTSNICKDCYKMMLYNSGSDTPEEVFVNIAYDEFGNIKSGMSQEDLDQLKLDETNAEEGTEDYTPVIQSLEPLRDPETAIPEDLLLISTELLPNADLPPSGSISSETMMNAYYANARSPKAIKARDSIGNYFIKLIKPPLTTKIELYKQTKSLSKPVALIASFSFVTDSGSYETGYFHPSVIRFDQTMENGQPTEIVFHEEMVHAHADQKKPIPFNLDDDDLMNSEYIELGLFSSWRNTSIKASESPDMNATVINGTLLTRDYQLAYLGTLFRSDTLHESED